MDNLETVLARKAGLVERIAHQRQRLARDLRGIQPLIGAADKGAELLAGARRHAGLLAAAGGLLLALRPRRTLAWARRGFAAWRTLRWVRTTLGM